MFLAAMVLCLPSAPAAAGDNVGVISHLQSDRIRESSGLAISAKFPDMAYTINDSNNKAIVWAIKISTGDVVGKADYSKFHTEDPESIYVDPNGNMWVADLGDNHSDRDNVSILSFPEPGPGSHKITKALHFPVKYAGGPINSEALLVNPVSGRVFIASKNTEGGAGTIYALPDPLRPGEKNVAKDLGVRIPTSVTDGTFTPDGKLVYLRTYPSVWIVDPRSWNMLRQMPGPTMLRKGESLALERDDKTLLLGSEGAHSPLIWLSTPSDPATDLIPGELDEHGNPVPVSQARTSVMQIFLRHPLRWGGGAVVGLVLLIAIAGASRRRRRR